LESKLVYDGRVVKLRRDRVIEPGGVEVSREIVVHPGSVVVLPLLPGNRVLLIRQYRYAAGQKLWELVAGGLEPGESILRAARRELLEETGHRARRFRRVLSFFPTPGFVAEEMHLVLATDLVPGKARPEADERIETHVFTLPELRRMMSRGRIRDGKTLVGLSWLILSGRRGKWPSRLPGLKFSLSS
jgi:ADP-ribose pyrophosphatase